MTGVRGLVIARIGSIIEILLALYKEKSFEYNHRLSSRILAGIMLIKALNIIHYNKAV